MHALPLQISPLAGTICIVAPWTMNHLFRSTNPWTAEEDDAAAIPLMAGTFNKQTGAPPSQQSTRCGSLASASPSPTPEPVLLPQAPAAVAGESQAAPS